MHLSVALVALAILHSDAAWRDVHRLYEDLLGHYNPDVIPMADEQPLVVKAAFYLTSIRDVDDKSQTISIKGWLKMLWVDERLRWSPAQYGNVSAVNMANSRIWTPDMVFFNGVGQVFFTTTGYMKTRVYSEGVVEYEPGGDLTLRCPLDLRRFPFDTQSCAIKLSPWSYVEAQVQTVAVALEVGEEEFAANEEWDISQLWMVNSSYESDNGKFSEAQFHFDARRRPFFQVVTLLLPVLLLATLNVFVFLLPAEDGEKINFACGLLLAYSVWLIQLLQCLPLNAGAIPLLGVYVIFLMLMAGFSIVATVYVIHAHCTPPSVAIPRQLHAFCSWATALQASKDSQEALTWKAVARHLDRALFYACSAALLCASTAIGVCYATVKDGRL